MAVISGMAQHVGQDEEWLTRCRCFHCGKPMFGPAIEWRGYLAAQVETVYFHPACAVEFSIRLLRDVHEIECKTPASLVLKLGY